MLFLHTHTHHTHRGLAYLQYLAAVRGAVDVLTGLVHAQCHTVEQDHHDANPLEPRINRTGVKEHSSRGEMHSQQHCSSKMKSGLQTCEGNGWIDGTGVSDQTENSTLFFIIRQGCRNLDIWTNLK